ncbi:hypothetical protein BDV33DRAFT_198566 [Aspergillus novoparasiticus]|uniref:Uncharacterized protein n=1 Tax=Aspergillus novoparasiticus TaxID=986946 RepID=A0A5N6FAB7_9EURO|nr:hypothetical protein BDV33DRAFT_198566 [Aspergillus novoparasiticus]
MICIAGNISFNGLIYPKSREPNAREYYEVVEGGADLITRFLHEAQAEHGRTVSGPHVDVRNSREERSSGSPAGPTDEHREHQSARSTSADAEGQGGQETGLESQADTSADAEGQSGQETGLESQADTPANDDGQNRQQTGLNRQQTGLVSPRDTSANDDGQNRQQTGLESQADTPANDDGQNRQQTGLVSPRNTSVNDDGQNRQQTGLVSPRNTSVNDGGQIWHGSHEGRQSIVDGIVRDIGSRRHSQAEVLRRMSSSVMSPGDDLMNAILDLFPRESTSWDIEKYRVKETRLFDSSPIWYGSKDCEQAEALVVEAPKITKQNSERCVQWLKKAKGKKLIYKMTRPLARGRIWDYIRRPCSGVKVPGNQLVVVVDANDLRAEGLNISRHLSWERTAQSFQKYTMCMHQMHSLLFCPNLIVLFGCEGAIHCREGRESTLFFDPKCAEGDFSWSHSRGMVDVTGAFIAGLVTSLAKDGDIGNLLPGAIRRGLICAQRLVEEGFISSEDKTPDYPVNKVMERRLRKQEDKISSIRIPRERESDRNYWSIFLNLMGDTTEIARFIVRNGAKDVLSRVQTAQFGSLLTADRYEVEGFRAITNLVEEYIKGSKTKPLSIGVFGPPGSGKSFAVTEVISGALHTAKIERLTFNISQFNQYSDLLSAFQRIRDVAVSGSVPLALFDEFDTSFGQTKLGWLRYFLAPMQDGEFLDNGERHPLGRSIFVFMGGTSATYADFTRSMNSADVLKGRSTIGAAEKRTPDGKVQDDFVSVKGPDFVSRLRGYVDIRGPDQLDVKDQMYSIRRAILLRAMLERRMVVSNNRLHVDDAVLAGLLKTHRFNHGARSLEAILDMSRVSGCREFERAALPSDAQLGLHVDPKTFTEFMQAKDGLGDFLHGHVSRKFSDRLTTLRAGASNKAKEILASYDTHTAADDIVRKLRSINCYVIPKSSDPEENIPFDPSSQPLNNEEKKLKLAQEDYERYFMEITNNNESGNAVTMDELVSWEVEDNETRKIFVDLVGSIPNILDECGYRVYSLEEGAPIGSDSAHN